MQASKHFPCWGLLREKKIGKYRVSQKSLVSFSLNMGKLMKKHYWLIYPSWVCCILHQPLDGLYFYFSIILDFLSSISCHIFARLHILIYHICFTNVKLLIWVSITLKNIWALHGIWNFCYFFNNSTCQLLK